MTLPLFADEADALPQITKGRKIGGRVGALLDARGDGFPSDKCQSLSLTFEGIKDDFHAGSTRKSGGREPWYPRGTEIRNERQVSIVAEDELALAARTMGIDRIEPGWIGANMVIEGIPLLTMLPPRTQLFFEGGVTLRVDGENNPCRFAGDEIARNFPERDQTELALSFVSAAKRRRGVVAWVEKPGTIQSGEGVTARIWEQWIYPAG